MRMIIFALFAIAASTALAEPNKLEAPPKGWEHVLRPYGWSSVPAGDLKFLNHVHVPRPDRMRAVPIIPDPSPTPTSTPAP